MKKTFNIVKANFVSLRITLISFPVKVMGQFEETIDGWRIGENYDVAMQGIYGVPQPGSKTDIAIKIFPRLLVVVTFIIGIISFIKIRKIDDKSIKKKKIKGTIYIMIILIILIILAFLLSAWLLGCTTCGGII